MPCLFSSLNLLDCNDAIKAIGEIYVYSCQCILLLSTRNSASKEWPLFMHVLSKASSIVTVIAFLLSFCNNFNKRYFWQSAEIRSRSLSLSLSLTCTHAHTHHAHASIIFFWLTYNLVFISFFFHFICSCSFVDVVIVLTKIQQMLQLIWQGLYRKIHSKFTNFSQTFAI